MAQSSGEWTLYLNKAKLVASSVEKEEKLELAKQSKGKLKLQFAQKDTSFIRSVLIMNEQRNTLLTKELKPACTSASFAVSELLSQTGGNDFTIYIVDVPADPSVAATMRIAPVAICHVKWI